MRSSGSAAAYAPRCAVPPKWWNRLRDSEWLSDCEMRLDDEFTDWRRLSAGVRYALDMAADNLRVLHGLLKSDADAALPFVATYPLTRTVLESASLAAWILAPTTRESGSIATCVMRRAKCTRRAFSASSF